jgi:hypothetical protein
MREQAVIRAYRFALDPTEAQEQALRSHCGARVRLSDHSAVPL